MNKPERDGAVVQIIVSQLFTGEESEEVLPSLDGPSHRLAGYSAPRGQAAAIERR
ncbi:MAG TPA: hypothetical protein VGK16_07360 [Candidatus Limnocylindrales bacterium]